MKKEYAALEPIGESQRAECLEILRQWKLHTWFAALIILAFTVLSALLIHMQDPFWSFLTAFAVYQLLGALVTLVVLAVMRDRFIRKIMQIPEMSQALFPDMPRYTGINAGKTSPDAVQIALAVILCVLCFPAGLIYLLYLDRTRRDQITAALTPADVLTRASESHAKSLGCGSFLLFVLAGGGMLLEAMMGSVAISKLNALNSNARSVCRAANLCVTDMDEKDLPLPYRSETHIFRSGGGYEEGSLEQGMASYFSDIARSGYWYALEFDGNGAAVRAWVSRSPLTEIMLTEPDRDAQRALLASFTHQDEAIGYYEEKSRASGAEESSGTT